MTDRPQPRVTQKAHVYETFGNVALLRMVEMHLPRQGAVLDVGCASGGLLAALEGRAGRREGVEIDPTAADRAAAIADVVHFGSITAVDLPNDTFDVVVLGDVLEHVEDPVTVLGRVRPLLRQGGTIVVSLPNVAHWSIRWSLLLGRWEYRPAGILDDTHLRFFTWSSGAELLERSGFKIITRRPIVPGLSAHVGTGLPPLLDRAWRAIGRRRPSLFAYQQLLVASPSR